jgi:hypothetical protein
MAQSNQLIMSLLRIITPEEVGEITTKHNGGKFISLTELVNERVQKNVYRNFSSPVNTSEEVAEAKILPFRPAGESSEHEAVSEETGIELNESELKESLSTLAKKMAGQTAAKANQQKVDHKEDENMSSFILIEKARLKKSQQQLKQKEILELYQKNINVDVEQIRGQENNLTQSRESGVLVNKKQY